MERLGLLDHREMATAVKHVQPGVRQGGAECFTVVQGHDAIQTSPDQESLSANGLHLVREVCINTRTLYQAYHHTTALPLSFELWPPAYVLPLGAKSVGLRCGNQSQPAKHRLGKRLLIPSSQVRGWSRRDIQPH